MRTEVVNIRLKRIQEAGKFSLLCLLVSTRRHGAGYSVTGRRGKRWAMEMTDIELLSIA